jgi:hypothetical protein
MQQNLIPKEQLCYVKSWSHGGQSLKKRRKRSRPLIPNKVTHVVFKSSKAKGILSFYSQKLKVKKRLFERAKKYHIIIQDWVNVGNHLHLKVKFKDPDRFKNFLRTFAALLARDITNANKSNPFGKFWDGLVFTRVLHSSFEELGLKGYFEGNHRQREMGYSERNRYLKQFNQFLNDLKSTKAAEKEVAEVIMLLPNFSSYL